MSAILAASAGPSIAWYLTRASGIVALLLLTAAVTLGVLELERLSTPRWPRFLLDALHRNVSLLAVVFLALHILTTVIDSFTSISVVAAFIPFTSSYRPFWLGLGAIACDMLLALLITSLLRRRLGFSAWRATHWLAYACWPIALLHGLGTGSDIKSSWMVLLTLACELVVLGAVCVRALSGWPQNARLRAGALALTGAFALFLALWVPSGPLGSQWARRSGTPTSLLPHSTANSTTSTAQAGR